jgi:mRNA-degrading endonuclease RelE of RelBE toxin-antitoxin system
MHGVLVKKRTIKDIEKLPATIQKKLAKLFNIPIERLLK